MIAIILLILLMIMTIICDNTTKLGGEYDNTMEECEEERLRTNEIREKTAKFYDEGIKRKGGEKSINYRFVMNRIKEACIMHSFNYALETLGKRKLTILDIGAGRGGDLPKYNKLGIELLYHVDISAPEVEEARNRYKEMKFTYPVKFIVKDAFDCSDVIQIDKVDLVVSNLAIHYAFYSRASVKLFFQKLGKIMNPGSVFMFTASTSRTLLDNCKEDYFTFEKLFDDSANDHKTYGLSYELSIDGSHYGIDWIIPIDDTIELAKEMGFRMICIRKFIDIYDDIKKNIKRTDISTTDLKLMSLYNFVEFQRV